MAINPATPAAVLEEILPDLELVLVMTVNPGFGGQEFLAGMLPKIRRVRQMIDEARTDCELEVDGGIEPHTAPLVVEAGARVLVAGSAVFHAPGGADSRHRPAQGRTRPAGTTDRLVRLDLEIYMTFYYPIQDYGPLMKGMVIGGLGIVHVFLAQMAIGGGMLLCYFEWLRRTGRSPNAGRFVNGYFQALVLVSFVLGALTGVAMWFTSIQVSPRTIGVLVDEFHWIWATEWTFFCVQVVSGYAFLRYKDRLSGRGRMLLLVIYSVAAWFSLFWINGILAFQLTPGHWPVTHSVWSGFFNRQLLAIALVQDRRGHGHRGPGGLRGHQYQYAARARSPTRADRPSSWPAGRPLPWLHWPQDPRCRTILRGPAAQFS